MNIIDTVYVVLGVFEGNVQIWRGGVFDTEFEANHEWNAYAECEGKALDTSKLRLVTIQVRSDGGVHTAGEAPRV